MKIVGIALLLFLAPCDHAQEVRDSAKAVRSYVLGPDDQISIHALHVEEIPQTPLRIGSNGMLRLPFTGPIKASGKTVDELEQEIISKLRPFILEPEVSVSVVEFHSAPVSVLGAVRNPGIYQLQGHKTLAEMLSLAGGPDQNAGDTVKITRRKDEGVLAVSGATLDPSGEFSVAEVSLLSILKAAGPAANIAVEPRDLITIPRAEMIYVVGQVQKSGGFVISEGKSMPLLQALSLAGGLDRTASPRHAVLLRSQAGATARTEYPVDLGKIMEGKAEDVQMSSGDILFVPNSAPKRAALRAVEAAIQAGTGMVIWRR